jgi:hypothetical protein
MEKNNSNKFGLWVSLERMIEVSENPTLRAERADKPLFRSDE